MRNSVLALIWSLDPETRTSGRNDLFSILVKPKEFKKYDFYLRNKLKNYYTVFNKK